MLKRYLSDVSHTAFEMFFSKTYPNSTKQILTQNQTWQVYINPESEFGLNNIIFWEIQSIIFPFSTV